MIANQMSSDIQFSFRLSTAHFMSPLSDDTENYFLRTGADATISAEGNIYDIIMFAGSSPVREEGVGGYWRRKEIGKAHTKSNILESCNALCES